MDSFVRPSQVWADGWSGQAASAYAQSVGPSASQTYETNWHRIRTAQQYGPQQSNATQS